jgi:hypothetical protein
MINDPVLIAARQSRKVTYERIGAAYPHDMGEGLPPILDAMPLKGRHIVLLELDANDDRWLIAATKHLTRKDK